MSTERQGRGRTHSSGSIHIPYGRSKLSLSKEGYITQTHISHTYNLRAIKLNLIHKKNGKLAASEAKEVFYAVLAKQKQPMGRA